MQTSTDFQKEYINKVVHQYDCGEITSATFVPKGVSDENYVVETTEGIFFLKKHRMEASKRIASIEKVGSFFSSHEIPIVLPLETRTGAYHYSDTNGCWVLYPFVTGKTYSSETMTPKVLKTMGTMLARIHLLTKDGIRGEFADVSRYFVPKDPLLLLSESDEIMRSLEEIPHKTDFDQYATGTILFKRQLIEKYVQRIKNMHFHALHLGHGDYHLSNVFFEDQSRISWIFDIDMAGPMPRIYDAVRSVFLMCVNGSFTQESIDNIVVFMQAYYRTYPFSYEELVQAIDLRFYELFSFWKEWAHYRDHDTRSDELYLSDKQQLKYLDEQRKELADMIYAQIK